MMRKCLEYLRLFWPSAFRRLLKQVESEAYQRGWENGFDRGHMRGWMNLRDKVHNGGNKYPHEKPNERN